MNADRRAFLTTGLAAPLLWAAAALGQSGPPWAPQLPPPRHIPDAPGPAAAKPDPHKLLKYNQEQLKKHVEQLYELSSDLRKEVNETNGTEVLSLNVVRKAEQIEKLAKQIKNLAVS